MGICQDKEESHQVGPKKPRQEKQGPKKLKRSEALGNWTLVPLTREPVFDNIWSNVLTYPRGCVNRNLSSIDLAMASFY